MRPLLAILFFVFVTAPLFGQTRHSVQDTTLRKPSPDTTFSRFKDSFSLQKNDTSTQSIKVFIKDEPTKSNWFKDVLPILTLLLGIFINRGIDFFTNRKRTRKHGERWVAELNSLKDPITKQVEYLKEFKQEHDKEKFDIPKLNVVSILDGESFNSLDKSELIKYLEVFRSNKYEAAIRLSNRVNIFISILKNHLKNLHLKFDEYLKGTSLHTTNLSKHLQDFLQRFAFYGVQLEKELHGDPLNDPRYRPVFDLVNSEIYPYMTQGNYDIYKLETSFLIPMFQFCGQHRLDDRIFPMAESIRGCITSIKGIKMEKHYFSENLQTIIDRYTEEQTQLTEILEDLKKKTVHNKSIAASGA
jgi:hypothetical protein